MTDQVGIGTIVLAIILAGTKNVPADMRNVPADMRNIRADMRNVPVGMRNVPADMKNVLADTKTEMGMAATTETSMTGTTGGSPKRSLGPSDGTPGGRSR